MAFSCLCVTGAPSSEACVEGAAAVEKIKIDIEHLKPLLPISHPQEKPKALVLELKNHSELHYFC